MNRIKEINDRLVIRIIHTHVVDHIMWGPLIVGEMNKSIFRSLRLVNQCLLMSTKFLFLIFIHIILLFYLFLFFSQNSETILEVKILKSKRKAVFMALYRKLVVLEFDF